MKCISLWQPWATLVAVGAKRIETRSWETHYHGPLAIHAAKRRVSDEEVQMLLDAGASSLGSILASAPGALPLGAIVATCELVECVRFGEVLPGTYRVGVHEWRLTEQELAFGNFNAWRFGWLLANVKPLDKPVPWKGKQGFFEVPDEVLKGGA